MHSEPPQHSPSIVARIPAARIWAVAGLAILLWLAASFWWVARQRPPLHEDSGGRLFGAGLLLTDLAVAATVIGLTALLIARRRAERRYRTLLATNQLLLGGATADDLLKQICSVAAQEGGFVLAYIGLDDAGPFIRATAAAGPAQGYLESLDISRDPGVSAGQGPSGIALRSGKSFYCNDFQREPATSHWAARGRRHGIRASAALPLRKSGRVIGLLSLYSNVRGHFDAEEIGLVEQMAADISLGLEHLQRQIEVQQSLSQLHQIESTVRAGAFRMALAGEWTWWSNGATALLHRADAPDAAAATAAELRELVQAAASTAQSFEIDYPVLDSAPVIGGDGALPSRWLRVTGAVRRGADPALEVTGIISDISERKALEVEIARATDAERQRLAEEMHDNLGQILTLAALQLRATQMQHADDAGTPGSELDKSIEQIQEALQVCRSLAHDAAPALERGLGPALAALAAQTSAAGIQCSAQVPAAAATLGGEQAVELFRIVQEAVANAVKHAHCTHIAIDVSLRGGSLELSIRDDGIGFAATSDGRTRGLGTRTMRYRAARAGGTIAFTRGAAGGAAVIVGVRRFASATKAAEIAG